MKQELFTVKTPSHKVKKELGAFVLGGKFLTKRARISSISY